MLLSTLTLLFLALGLSVPSKAQVLTPPYFNLAEGRRITATSTCGVDVDEPELYCKLVGANSDKPIDFNVIQGQLCDYCDPNDPQKHHPPENAIDGSERWWQSPPLSRGMDYNEVNLTVDLGQLFQIAYVVIKMANSPRPGIWALERSVDNGKTYTAWQYFADNEGDCERYFGADTLKVIVQDDDVICTTRFSKVVPLEGGEIFVSLLNDRPSAKDFFNSSTLQEYTRATNVRLRLIRTKTLLGHLMHVERQDPTVTRRYFYSIKDISIGGRCVCNGHASVCDITDPDDKYQLQCRCEHNTCGDQCEKCCAGFIQKKWRPASYTESFVCEPCNCFGHTDECLYDEEVDRQRLSLDIYSSYEGGGVCQNCRHNTEGINCHKCKSGFYRPYDKNLNDTDVCSPCDCSGYYYTGNCSDGNGLCECKKEFLPPYCNACNEGYYDYPECKPCDCFKEGTIGEVCEVGGGQCPCKDNYAGLNCNTCASGFFNFSVCSPCECSPQGSVDSICDLISGQCKCHNEYGGLQCERCEHGYYDITNGCEFCNCDSRGTTEEICDKETGKCLCQDGYSGVRCDNSAPGFWGYPLVRECNCHEKGSSSSVCDSTGKCACLNGYAGSTCDQCSPGFFNFPNCEPCNCDQAGSIGISCDAEGKCQCRYNFDGKHCDQCRDKFYNFPLCEECNCDPAGVPETFGGCGEAPVGELCECKERVTGRICNKCRSLFWNLNEENPLGCEDCACHSPGTVGSLQVCNTESGQCHCKPHVTSRRCDECQDGKFNLMEDNLFGCTDCNCNIGGSNNNICDKITGQCSCRHRIQGQRCDQPMQTHYFPTLYQYKFEIEDGKTPQNTPVRYGYDEYTYPGYSWRGYAVYSDLQKETLHDIYITNPSLYRLIFNYKNPSNQVIKGKVKIIPENPLNDRQEVDVYFEPTMEPKLMTVSTVNGFPLPFVMDPGTWTVSIQNTQSLLLDYMIFLPLAYYEATLLTKRVTAPRQVRGNIEETLTYKYPDISNFDSIYATAGYIDENGTRSFVELFDDEQVISSLNTQPMAKLGGNIEGIQFDLRLKRPGEHVILISYFTPNGAKATSVYIVSETQNGREKGRAVLYDCTYSWLCRQVVTNLQGEIAIFNFDSNYVTLTVSTRRENGLDMNLHSITAIHLDEWHMDLVTPQPGCIMHKGECITTSFPAPADATKVEFEANLEGKSTEALSYGLDNETILVYLNESDPMVDVTGKLRSAGRYVFVVHYFQPNHPQFNMDVLIQNGQFYEGILSLKHCPSTYGCRAVITHHDQANRVFDILENFVLTLMQPNGYGVWLDYLLVIPEQSFSEDLLNYLPLDETAEFFEKCGQNHFNIDPQDTGFCREAAFALTSDYNNGAFPCQCNFQGSVSFECLKFGGQCPCKANVIGRECNQCRTGHFGFPDCKPCDCPTTALCDPLTGACICPPRVVGERCERCALNTYGFDPIIGCEECQCDELGVINGDLQCNLATGQCRCKDNVVGRRCDKCAPGYWSFPFCQLCNCDLRGTEAEICNQIDATCFCKANTEGASCDVCVPGTYNIDEINPDGCTKCFCFGKSQFCSSSNFVWTQMAETEGWQAINFKFLDGSALPKLQKISPDEYPNLIYMNLTHFREPEKDGYLYLVAPIAYYGNRIKSYGGTLSFKILTISDSGELDLSADGDVILQGQNITALHFYEEVLEQGVMNQVNMQLSERNFKTLEGVPIKRENFMTLLKQLTGIYIRVQYGAFSSQARISDFSLETATLDFEMSSKRALSVEQCQCPPNYKGSSCEDCAEGYYRTSTGPYGGFCVPCKCNNHADTCDPITGECIECRDNTIGFNCEKCSVGYFGDAKKGTPYDCLICSCPLPSVTNNFAISCEVLSNGEEIDCECQEGYTGTRCDICAPGHYGQPTIIGDYCKPCECNNNIDITSRYACDDINGLCLNCLNNTYGSNCERCAPGYFGDAVLLKNCQECACDFCGTRECRHYTGVCDCHENVIGDRCDRCAPEYWGFASCQGCHACNCAIASESRQCNEETGQCKCRPGVTGQRCDRCQPGYWSYTEFGCTECTCRVGFSVGVGCDPITGQCSCLPGVIGDNCDGCPYRWALVEGVGCQECDECVHALLDTTDELNTLINPVIQEYESAAQSFFLHQRLQVINSTISNVRPRVNKLDISDEEIQPVQDKIGDIFADAMERLTRAKLLKSRATGSASDGIGVRDQALEVLDAIFTGIDLSKDIVQEINSLSIGLETGTGAKIDQAIREAEKIVENMKNVDYEPKNDNVRQDYEIAHEFLDRIKELSAAENDNQGNVDDAVKRLKTMQENVQEMEEIMDDANVKAYNVSTRNKKSMYNGIEILKKEHEEVKMLGTKTEEKLKDSENMTDQAETTVKQIELNIPILEQDLTTLEDPIKSYNESLLENFVQFSDLQEPSEQAIQHSFVLNIRAAELDNLLSDTRQVTENALKAANAHEDIVTIIEEAHNLTNEAEATSQQAVDSSSGVNNDATLSVNISKTIYRLAESKIKEVEDNLLFQLDEAQLDLQGIDNLNSITKDISESVISQLDDLKTSNLNEESEDLQEKAIKVHDESEEVSDNVKTWHSSLEEYGEIARTRNKNNEDAKRNIKLAVSQIEKTEKNLPGALETTKELLIMKKNNDQSLEDIGNRLEKLRRTIAKTREQTNKIKVGIDFDQGSALELKNPEDLSDTATSTELSFFIRTTERSGLPLFLGTPVGGSNNIHRTLTDDFIAIELDEGYVRLTASLGGEPQSVVHKEFVSDNEWHKIHVKRISKVIQLSVFSEDQDENEVEPVDKVLTGTYSILNLDPKVSKLYVGGIPAGIKVNPSLMNTYYSGQIEELTINKRPIGLWNFVERGPEEFSLKGAKERLVLKGSKEDAHILRFDGTGYIKSETKGHETTPELSAVLSFKTFAEDGLLFIVENGENEYVSLEILGGKIVYQHKFGQAMTTLQSDSVYNDNKWHTIEATRVMGDAVMKINLTDIHQSRSTIKGGDFSDIPPHMYFGGFPGQHAMTDVTNIDFRGCIRDVRITDVTVDFSRSTESIGSVPGCSKEAVSLVSFERKSPGYVKLPKPEDSGFQLVFKFKTSSPNGLLFYTETSDRSIYLSLSLAEGALVLRSSPNGEVTTGPYSIYHDSEWHIIIATRENNELRLDIDDFESYSNSLIHESVPFDGPVFFGGLPEYYPMSPKASATDTNFYGCIGDATLNGKIIDFAAASRSDRPGAMLETCSSSHDDKYMPGTTSFSTLSDIHTSTTLGGSYTPFPFFTYPRASTEAASSIESTTPMNKCALPIVPEKDIEVTPENGYRFGVRRDAHLEFLQLPENIRGDFIFSLEFRTEADKGIIFYASSTSHRDFVTIYMNNGKIVFSFNPGSVPAIMRSVQKYNNGKWHKLVAHRNGNAGRLEIDGFIVANMSIIGQAKHIDHQSPYYFGGLSHEIIEKANGNTEGTFLSFNGCLRNFRMNNRIVDGQKRMFNVTSCSYKVEQGIFFEGGEKSHAVVQLKFVVGTTFEVSMDIKPRKNNGVLMSVHGRRDFFLLQLRDGIVEVKVDNGNGVIIALFRMNSQFSICDGNWHTIKVAKNKHVVVLIVDGINAEPAYGPLGSSSTDTNKPLFIGSQHRLGARRGGAVREKYVGCMKNLFVNSDKIDLSYIYYVGNVKGGVCPTI